MSLINETDEKDKKKRKEIGEAVKAFNNNKTAIFSIFGHRTIIKGTDQIKIIIKVESPERSFYQKDPAEIENEVGKFIKQQVGYDVRVKINKSYLCSGKKSNIDYNC